MKVFICYSHEQRELAQRITLALEGSDVDVFFDREDLPPGGEFNLAIRTAIRRCDLFVFIASRASIRDGAYTMAEMSIVEHRWPHPAERVLTLLADATPIGALPPYLSAVTVLAPAGDPVAELVDAVARWRERRRRLWLRRGLVAGAILAGAAGLAVWLARPAPAVEEADVAIDNSHLMRLKNGHHVRLTGSLVRNDSNVPDPIIRKYIEWDAWRYNRCYDEQFGSLAGAMPEGNVEIAFEVADQLPSNAGVAHSDFARTDFGTCVQATVSQQTLNAAGPKGAGKVVYRFRFEPT
ncbi:MAG: toll/interleukin-1 receptor domain-containing protein [Caldimonas sp.]